MTQPYRYDANFLTKQEADELFEFVKQFPRVRPQNPFNSSLFLRRTSVAHWNDYGVSAPSMRENQTTERKSTKEKEYPTMDAAPRQIKQIAIKLSLLATKPVNYISILGYEKRQTTLTSTNTPKTVLVMREYSLFRWERLVHLVCGKFVLPAESVMTATKQRVMDTSEHALSASWRSNTAKSAASFVTAADG